MLNPKFFILLFYFSLFSVNSQTLNKKEYDCIETLLTNLGSISNVNKNVTTSEYIFCGSNSVSPIVSIHCSEGSISTLYIGRQSNVIYTLKDEISCYQKLKDFSLLEVNYNSSALFNSFPKSLNKFSLVGINLNFSKFGENVQILSVSVYSQTIPTLIKFSWLVNTSQVILSPSVFLFKNSHLFTFENDLGDSQIWYSTYIKIISLNIPSFKNTQGFVVLTLVNGYDQSSWSKISECYGLLAFEIISDDLTLFPSDELSKIYSPSLSGLKIEVPFKSVTKMTNLSSISESIELLTFTKGGRDFTLGGLMPIILPSNEAFKTFVFNDGYINNLDISLFTNVKFLSLKNNSMSGTLPSVFIPTKLKSIDISNNNIYGELDDSLCELDITVTNNLMTGSIPSCFTCFFDLPEINLKSRFTGNNFTNIDQPSTLSIISPNLMFEKTDSSIGFLTLYHYNIFGKNLGGLWLANGLMDIVGVVFVAQVVKPNTLISFYTFSPLPSIITISYSKMNPNYTFTLSADNRPPQLNAIDWESDSLNLLFDGSYFSYNLSIINITIGNYNCQVTSANFYKINCKLSNSIDYSLRDILSFITIGNLTTQFTLNPGEINYITYCKNNCSGGGICLSDTGTCKCDSNHQGDDCSIPFVECLNECNNNIGQCNNQTGICVCPTNPYGWSGVDCSIPLHTISAVLPSNTKGGNASIYGWFGNIHSNLQVFIGNKECKPIYNTSEFEIKCNAPAGTGLKSVSVIQNSINVTAKDIYQYYSTDKTCPNDCTSTSNGICNTTTGYCNCIGRWSGYDCSLFSNPSGGGGGSNNGLPGSNSTIDNNTGNTNITNQQTNYQILITKLVEIDFSGKSIKEYILLNKWTIYSNNSKMIYTFIQSIQNDQCNITYTIEEINKDREISFADVIFKLTSGSVKMTVSIENYQYSSNLNTLQLQMKSSVNEIQTNGINDCNNDQIEIDNKSNQDNSLNYIAIKKDAKVLNGRFIDRIESDGKSTFMQTVLVSKSNDSIIVGMNLPHCVKKCLIDPDFSVLVSPEFADECDGDKRKSWFLPVVVVVPIVGITLIILLTVFIIKKRFVEMYLFKSKIKKLANIK